MLTISEHSLSLSPQVCKFDSKTSSEVLLLSNAFKHRQSWRTSPRKFLKTVGEYRHWLLNMGSVQLGLGADFSKQSRFTQVIWDCKHTYTQSLFIQRGSLV